MGEVLRRCILTKSSQDMANDGGNWDDEKWQNTQKFLESSFGVDQMIVGEQLRFLELFKQVEMSAFETVNNNKH